MKIFILIALALVLNIGAKAQYIWNNPSATTWNTAGSWTPSGPPTAATIAQFDANPAGGSSVTIAGLTQAGSIVAGAARTTSLTIAGTAITLSGNTISLLSSVVIANLGTGALNIACPISQGSAKAYLTAGSTSSLTPGGIINITGIITGSGGANFQGGGTWNGTTGVCGGVLKLGATNLLTGASLAVGATSSGILELGINTGASTTLVINNNSQLYLSAGGAFSVPLILNGTGNNAASPYGRGALRVAGSILPAWGAAVTLASNSVISVGSGSTLSLSSSVLGAGQLIKEGAGTLILSGVTNSLNFAGGIMLSEGSITITRIGSIANSLPITLSQTLGNSTTLTFTANTTQTIGSLSSSFANTSGSISQMLVLVSGSSLTINQSANTTFGYGTTTSLTSYIIGPANTNIIKTGSGSLTLNCWPNVYLGGVSISLGTIVMAPAATITTSNTISLSGGTLATTGITNNVVCSLGVLNNVANSTITLDAVQTHQLRFTSLGTNTGVITITGWQGGFNGTSGTKAKLYIGTSATLTPTQLAQFQFQDAGNIIPAVQIAGGEIVPKAPITITAASYGPFYNNVGNVISVGYSTTATYFTGSFKVQLSDSAGTFANFTSNIIGTGTGTIAATIPSGTTPSIYYRVRVLSSAPYVAASDTSSAIRVLIGKPVISSLSAYNTALPGTSISISGLNFNSTPANNIVYFGAVKAVAQAGSSITLLNVTVPYGATMGPLTAYDTITRYASNSTYSFLPQYNNVYFESGSINFQPKVDYITGTCPNIAAIGDLDGDGLPDLVSINKISRNITIMQNTGGGTSAFSTPAITLLSQGNPSNVKISDIDGDGRPDLIIATGSGSSSIGIYRNITNFTLGTPRTLAFATRVDVASSQSPGVIAVADFDGDGKMDIAAGCYGNTLGTPTQGVLQILRNNTVPGTITAASFTSLTYTTGPILNALTSSICTGDFNADGMPDLAVINENYLSNGTVTVFKNTSNPSAISFTSQSLITGVYPIDIQCADIDGDGGTDIIVTESQSNAVSYFKNANSTPSSAISFGLRTVISGAVSNPAGVAIGDLDADGKPDIAVANFVYGGGISVFKNSSTPGSPSFTSSSTLTTNRFPAGLTIGDVDADGYPEIMSGNSGSDTGNTVSVFRNTPVPIIGTISSANDSMCVGQTTTLSYSLSLPAGETGAWSSANTAIATVNSAGVVYGVAAGTIDISYTVTVTRGNISRSVIRSVVVKPLPVVNVTGFRGVCQGLTTTLTGTPAGGAWSHANAVTSVSASGAVTGESASGTDIISYTYVSPVTGCSNADTQAMTIILPPNPGTISGADSVCPGANTTLITSGDMGGKWFSSNNLFASVDSLTGIVTGQNSGSSIINYKISNGCGIYNSYKPIGVRPLPDAGAITGSSTVCSGASISLNNPVAGGVWTSSNTVQATINASGVVTGVAVGTPVISYTTSNSCGSSSATLGINVITVPPAPAAISGTSTICNGATTSLSSATTGGTWVSGNLSLATVTASTGVVSGIAVGSPQISYTVSNTCGASAPALITVNILSIPDANITSAIVPCDGYSSNIVFTGTPNDVVSYSVDGGSNIDGTLTGGTFSLSTGILTSSHTYLLHTVRNVACAILKDTSVTLVPLQMTWLGGAPGAETSWSTAANWSCGSVPLVTDNVLIPSVPNVPVVSSVANSKNLTIATLAGLTISGGGSINIKGNVSNQGYINGNGAAILNGAALQKITGKGTIDNLDLNNSAGAKIDTGAHVVIGKTLSVTAGTFNTNDSLELASTDTMSTARIAALPASGSLITGKVQVDQYVIGGYRRYRFVGHPFSDTISLSQIQTYIDITGPGGSLNGFQATSSNAPSAFRLDPMTANSSLGYDPGWKPFTRISNSAADTNRFHPGQGLRIFFRGSKGEGLGYLGYTGGYTPSATTFKMMGHVNQGALSIRLSKGLTDPGNQEFNMVGNPYPSPVDIGTIIHNAWVSNQVVGSAFYVWDPTIGASGQFVPVAIGTSSATPYYIQANTSFQVRAHHDGSILSFDESNKAATPSNYLFKESAQFVALNVYDANYHLWDMLKFNFTDAASDKDDEKYDATKIIGSDFAFYSNSADGKKLAIDARPFAAEKVIPLGVNSNYMQEFIIRADNADVPAGGSIVLHDKLLEKYIEMTIGSEYKFTISNDKATQGDRFELALKPATVSNVTGLSMQMTPNPATNNVSINFTSADNSEVKINVMDMTGVNVYSGKTGKIQNGSFNVSLEKFAAGIYMVELIQGDKKITQKLVKE